MFDLIPLHMLAPGQQGRVSQLLGRAEEVHRLHELGVSVGTHVEMIQPGVPCIVSLGGTRLAFRNEAFQVLVQAGDAA